MRSPYRTRGAPDGTPQMGVATEGEPAARVCHGRGGGTGHLRNVRVPLTRDTCGWVRELSAGLGERAATNSHLQGDWRERKGGSATRVQARPGGGGRDRAPRGRLLTCSESHGVTSAMHAAAVAVRQARRSSARTGAEEKHCHQLLGGPRRAVELDEASKDWSQRLADQVLPACACAYKRNNRADTTPA